VETTTDIGAIFRDLPAPAYGLSFDYRLGHDPANADGDGTHEEYRDDDHVGRYHAQILIHAEDASTHYPYVAVRVEPDRLSLVEYDGADITELDTADIESAEDTWYTLIVRLDGSEITVLRLWSMESGPSAAAPVAVLNGESTLVSGTTDNTGFTVGETVDCAFRGLAYTTAPDTVNARVDFAYDAYGRRVLETVTGGDGSTWWKRQYIWDGWRLLQERNALTGAVIADYYYGPNYVDELLLCRRDLDGNGSYAADGSEDFYYLTDHQYSTLAIVDGRGTIVERYSYTPFGEASYYDGDGAPIGGSAIGNRFLFTGRERHEILPLYDYRNRMYDPGSGRFISPDPVYIHEEVRHTGGIAVVRHGGLD
jgi:RHS repeat-associated protein